MKLLSKLDVPTGRIITACGKDRKPFEFLFVGDYGKNANIKADFLGITRELNGVPNGEIEPLEEKIVVTMSTQSGCSMNCKFCDVPKVGKGNNLNMEELRFQLTKALEIANKDYGLTHTKRLNIHFARMGEPTFNNQILTMAYYLSPAAGKPFNSQNYAVTCDVIHPVISTMMPRNNKNLRYFIEEWIKLKNIEFGGDAGLQLSINSTNEEQRQQMFSGNTLPLTEIADIMVEMPAPVGRKYTLNFALADEYIVDEVILAVLFPPSRFICKITPLHKTTSSETNNIKTTLGYEEFTPYKDVEARLKSVGYDVIVFVPSYDEDNGLITCGNAILSGKLPTTEYQIHNY